MTIITKTKITIKSIKFNISALAVINLPQILAV